MRPSLRWLASRCEAMRSQRERIYPGRFMGEREISSGHLGLNSTGRIDPVSFPLIPAFSPRRRVGEATRLNCLDFSGSSHRMPIRYLQETEVRSLGG